VRRVRLLHLAPRVPHPSRKGDQLVPYHRLRVLGARHEITLVTFYEDEDELDALDAVRPHCSAIAVVPLGRWKPRLRVAVRGLFSRSPLQVLYYDARDFERAVQSLAGSEGFDVAHGYMLRMTPYLERLGLPSVLEAMDAMQLRLERQIPRERLVLRALFREELRRIRSYERSIDERVDRVVVVSDLDARYLGRAVTTIPNGVDAALFRPQPERRAANRIVFSGTMSYGPNIDAALWFATRCFPQIRRQLPTASFVIAGINPPLRVRRLEQTPGVRVTGFVPQMSEVLQEASVAVAPMLSGSGIQNKILEALACELPVVTTTIGLGGLGAVPGRDLVVADGEGAFAEAVSGLLADRSRADELGRRGREYVLATHTWERGAEQVEQIYHELVGAAPRRRPLPVS
jgi:polysaccharide biosynthesis protein PslH